MSRDVDNRRAFLSWLNGLYTNQDVISEYIEDIEKSEALYNKYTLKYISIYEIDDELFLDGVIEKLEKKEADNNDFSFENAKYALLLYKEFVTSRIGSSQKPALPHSSITSNDTSFVKSIMNDLSKKYSHEKAISVRQIINENSSVNFSKLTREIGKHYGKSLGEFFKEYGLIAEKAAVNPVEELEKHIEELQKRYRLSKATTLSQVMRENSDLPMGSITSWVKKVHNTSLRVYLIKIGVIVELPEETKKTSNNDSILNWKSVSSSDTDEILKQKLMGATEFLVKKYASAPVKSLVVLQKENTNISFSYYGVWTKKFYHKTAGQYLTERGVLQEKIKDTLPPEEHLSVITKTLLDKYANSPAFSLSQIANENPDISVSMVNTWTKAVYDMTAREYFVQEGIIDDDSEEAIEAREAAINRSYDIKELNNLKQLLTDEFYFIEDIKSKYFEKYGYFRNDVVKSRILRKASYRKYSDTYIIRDSFASASEYFESYFMRYELLDLDKIDSRILEIPAAYSVLKDLKNSFDFLEYEPNKYIRLTRIQNVHSEIDVPYLFRYVDEIITWTGNEVFFTIYSAKKDGFSNQLHNIGFDNFFLAELVRTTNYTNCIRICGESVFSKDSSYSTAEDFLYCIMEEKKAINIYDLCNYLHETYGIPASKEKICSIVRNTTMYYDGIMEKVYLIKKYYYNEF